MLFAISIASSTVSYFMINPMGAKTGKTVSPFYPPYNSGVTYAPTERFQSPGSRRQEE